MMYFYFWIVTLLIAGLWELGRPILNQWVYRMAESFKPVDRKILYTEDPIDYSIHILRDYLSTNNTKGKAK